MQSFLSLLEHFFKVNFTKYKITTLNKSLILPLLLFLGHYFQGEFVKTVNYFGRLVPYLYFILIAKAAAIHFMMGYVALQIYLLKKLAFYTL